jgi:hypothetical protein
MGFPARKIARLSTHDTPTIKLSYGNFECQFIIQHNMIFDIHTTGMYLTEGLKVKGNSVDNCNSTTLGVVCSATNKKSGVSCPPRRALTSNIVLYIN